MYKFSELSLSRLNSCHKDIQTLMKEVMTRQIMDFSILQGYRNKEDQNEAYKRGTSKLRWPHSRHNHSPSLAVDIAAYPISNFNDDNTNRTIALAWHVKKIAKKLDIPIYWGGDWHPFVDIYHFQLPISYRGDYGQGKL